ncbi:hypothetical protein MMC17_006626 [Xylographa soralifera]|nr:hypothetical protein [Xylographa soralifera]
MTAPPFRVKAVYDYSSPHDDDLSFPNNQIITVTDEEDADWYYGEYSSSDGTKHQGLFPKNFVERYEPATPPRPSRPARPRKEAEPAATAHDATEQPPETGDVADAESVSSPRPAPVVEIKDQPVSAYSKDSPAASQPAKPEGLSSATSGKSAEKPAVPGTSKAAAPPIVDKPSGNSFRDRIAAFNKSAAPPVAPVKPGGLGQAAGASFVKKSYVAPPPSRNAYVPISRELPPQKVYHREEDPEIAEQVSNNSEATNTILSSPQITSADDNNEEQPKPTSLKERIALLQKQQLEQAARHAETPKKEKPKRPPKKRMDSYQSLGHTGINAESEDSERVHTEEATSNFPGEAGNEEIRPRAQSTTRHRSKSRGATPLASPTREYQNDPNDADQSGAGETEDGGEASTERDDSDEKPKPRRSMPPQPISQRPAPTEIAPDQGFDQRNENDEGEDEDEDEEEEEEIDPEVKRKMEIRERMAKMSGGMGMAGMFGPPGGIPLMGAKKQKPSGSSAREKTSEQTHDSNDLTAARHQPVMALPGMQRVRSPEETEKRLEVSKEEEPPATSAGQGRASEQLTDVEDVAEEFVQKPRQSEERGVPPPVPQGRPVPAPPPISRGLPPSIPNERAVPPRPLPSDARPLLPPPSAVPMSLGTDLDSDDEMSLHPDNLTLNTDLGGVTHPINQAVPQIPQSAPGLPMRPQGPRPPAPRHDDRDIDRSPNMVSPIMPNASSPNPNRSSRVPPIPGYTPAVASPPQTRAPPPPPPAQAPLSRRQTGENRAYLAAPTIQAQESEEEVTEYDGDYDTDMASSVPHKDALRSHARDSSVDEPLTGDEAAYHHQGLPSLGPVPGPPAVPLGTAPRAMPPPPPNQPPKHSRQSSEMPRTVPPPPPPPPKEQSYGDEDSEDDDYIDGISKQNTATTFGSAHQDPAGIRRAEDHNDDLYNATPPQQYPSSPSIPAPTSFPNSPAFAPPMPRKSLDVLRSSSTRRSMDNTRPSIEQGFMADDVDLGRGSQWWLQRKMPPPVFQNRTDISFEMEESNATQQSGGQSTIKHVYVLFMDYSQTVITARYDTKDPSKVEFQQRHEPPPLGLRQDQLEDAHTKFGARIAETANTKLNHTVGDGTPFTLVVELMNAVPGALPPVGTRAYGALVYTNLANASVSQHDEIRSGDIVSFRNARLQGHRGPVKQKYNVEVGKPDHVAIVVDWDGTKKKVRAWEQGRESKKVKIESFKLGDLRSGEVKVWRVMAREWVGWGGGGHS